MAIDPSRISRDIEAIAGFNEGAADVGFSRPTFCPSWRKARDYVIAEAEAAGCKVRVDAAGNVHARQAGLAWEEKVWLSGSHIDTVPTGGKYDGVMGVVAPLEALRAGFKAGRKLPLELIIFAEEEGTTFGFGMMGSRLWCGASADSMLRYLNKDGLNYFQAGESHGVRVDGLEADRLQARNYFGLVEIHAEQGPAMWAEGTPIAVVTGIAGRMQFVVDVPGQANHAGSTSMRYRNDALVAAAAMITDISRVTQSMAAGAVATVGRIHCEPNAINVIPGRVTFTIDVRSADPRDLSETVISSLVTRRSAGARCVVTECIEPVALDAELCGRLNDGTLPTTSSGALHDAAILAPHLPTAMLFVASRDGISHNPVEFSRIEDIEQATRVLARLVGGG